MGVVMRPIPPSLLPDSMDVRVPLDSDLGGEFSEETARIEGVRFEDSAAMARRPYVLTDGSRGLVYVDAANSAGAFEVPVGSLVSVSGGGWMTAVKVVACRGFFGAVHHWEIEVA